MPTVEEQARLILSAEERGFAEAKAKIAALEAKLADLDAAYQGDTIAIGSYVNQAAAAEKALGRERAALSLAEEAVREHGSAQAALAEGSKKSGQGILQLSFAIQDFLSANGDLLQGLYRVQNNLPVIAERFGLDAGLAGQISLVTLVIGEALPYIIQWASKLSGLVETVDQTTGAVEGLQKQIKALEEQPVKLSADVTQLEVAKKQLDALQAAQKAYEEFGALRSEAVRTSGAAVKKLLEETEGGAGKVVDALEKAEAARLERAGYQPLQAAEAAEGAARQRIAEREAQLRQPTLPASAVPGIIDAIERDKRAIERAVDDQERSRQKLLGEAQTTVGAVYKGATEGDVAQQREFQERLRGAGMGGLARRVGAVSPENVRAKQLEEEGAKIEEEALKELAQSRKDQSNALAEQLEAQGAILEEQAKAELKAIKDERDKATAEQKRQAGRAAQAERRRIATLAKRIGGGTLGEAAQEYAARVQAARPGISDAGLRADVSQRAAVEVARRAPQLAPAERAGVVTAVTEQALAAPPEEVRERQARTAAAAAAEAPRQQRAATSSGYAQEAEARGFNPQAAAEIGRRASAAFARTGDLEGSFMEAIAGFQQVLVGMQQHQQRLAAGLARVQMGNAALQARQRSAQSWPGG